MLLSAVAAAMPSARLTATRSRWSCFERMPASEQTKIGGHWLLDVDPALLRAAPTGRALVCLHPSTTLMGGHRFG